MIQFTFDFGEGTKPIQQAFAAYAADLSDMTEPFTQIADDLQSDFALNMATEGGLFSSGKGWAPLQPKTITERVREGYGAGPILWRTGELGKSLSGDGPDAIKQVTPNSLTVGTSTFYGQFHQSGTRFMPQRRIVGLSWARRSLIVRRMGDWIRAKAVAAGLAMTGGEG